MVHAVDILLKIAEYVSFAGIIPDMVVQARKSNAVYVGDALNYKINGYTLSVSCTTRAECDDSTT